MTRTTPTSPATLPRGPFLLLGLMTATTVGGPFLIGAVLRGGVSPAWPPDRPVEWATVLGTSGAVVGLMGACLALLWTNRSMTPPPPSARAAETRSPATEVEP